MSSLLPIKQIKEAKHILIKSDLKSFPQASVLYSYLLQEHKKVSLYLEENKSKKYAFLAWFDKIRTTKPLSADLEIDADISVMELYLFLQNNGIKINKKMATALYCGFFESYENFLSPKCDGMLFAAVGELLAFGAEHTKCVENLCKSIPLSRMRLQGTLLQKFVLQKNASVAFVEICDEDLQQSGATMDDLYVVAAELLKLVHVQEVHLLKRDAKNKILKIIKDV